MNKFKGKSIILFDGVCNLCNSSVNFIIKHDKKKKFIFTSLQSDAAKEILLQFQTKKLNMDSILLIENGTIYKKSTAVFKILKHLNSGYKLLYFLIIVPEFIRDFLYDKIATRRYKWFGKSENCMIPKKELKSRFLKG